MAFIGSRMGFVGYCRIGFRSCVKDHGIYIAGYALELGT